jgi:uncharacterized protein (DUF1015 family)
MADIYPFRAYRYSPKAGPLERLVTQPYDKISPQMQKRYLELSPYNLVRIILGERFAEDSAAENVYTRAARYLTEWVSNGILIREPNPCLFAYFQEFTLPDTGERLVRKGFIGVTPVEDYSAGIVHRHELTLSGPKQDRLELLRHTRMHFEQIFVLYSDPEEAVDRVLAEASGEPPVASVKDEYGAVHTVWRIAEPVWIASIQHHMADKKLIIADGHHRYETALAFRNEHPELEDAGRVMMTFVNLHSPGLRILATHRLVHGVDWEKLRTALSSQFRLTPIASMVQLREAWQEPHPGRIRIGVAAPQAQLYLLESPREGEQLDVTFLHRRILEDLLGIGEEDVRNERRIRYIRGAEAACEEVREGRAELALLLEPASVHDVARIALSGGVMPQKSTDFYPKLLSGLAGYRLEK